MFQISCVILFLSACNAKHSAETSHLPEATTIQKKFHFLELFSGALVPLPDGFNVAQFTRFGLMDGYGSAPYRKTCWINEIRLISIIETIGYYRPASPLDTLLGRFMGTAVIL